MAGRGPASKDDRVNKSDVPQRGEWQTAPGIGWQHGEVPLCPARSQAARDTWATWMASWVASNWTPEDLPNLRLVIKLWAKADTAAKPGPLLNPLRLLMDDLGITRKGQQDRRWKPPEGVDEGEGEAAGSAYEHLRVVS